MDSDDEVPLIALTGSLIFALASAQSVSLSVYPGSVPPGGTATLTLTYTDASPTVNVAAIQWQLELPPGLSAAVPVAAGEAVAANKVISYNAANGYTILAGTGTPLNATPMASGILAIIAVTAALNGGSGVMKIGFGSDLPLLGADANGNGVPVSGGSVTLVVLSRFRRTPAAALPQVPHEP